MANEVVGVQIKVDSSQATQSLGSIKKQLREAQNEVVALSDKFGATSKEAVEAAKRAAELKDRIGDAKALTDAFNPDQKFKAFSQSLSGVAGGFAAVQGAIGLVGVKSEEVEKTLLKVQSALALSQGLESLGNSIDSFKQLGAVIKSQVVTAFSTLRGAIIATGVGALAVGIGLLIANFDAVKKAVLNLIPGLGKVADFIGGLINKVTDFVGITSEAGRATEKLIKDNEKAIKDSERFLDLNADKYDEYTQRKIKANLEFKKKQNEFLKDEELSETQRNEFIRQAREKANREILKSDEDRNEKVKSANKKAAEDAKAAQKKAAEDAKLAREAELLKVVAGRLNEEGLLAEIDNRRKESIKSIDPIIATQANLQAKVIGDRVALETEAAQKISKEREEEFKRVQLYEQGKVEAYQSTATALGALGQVVGQETAAGKALSAASALINTYLGITQIWANKTVIPEPFGTIQKVAATITAAASGFAAVKNINRTQVPGFGGGGVSAPSFSPSAAPITPASPQAALTQLNQQSINQLSSATNRAYVVESDVTNSQERVTRINRAARLA
jgi:hypothetical protein